MRCLKRYVAREIYRVVTNPPHIPTGTDIRQQRLQAGDTLTALAVALSVAPTRLSHLARGLDYNINLAQQAHHWLIHNTT